MRILLLLILAVWLMADGVTPSLSAQSNATAVARGMLSAAERVTLAGEVDSNSPVIWDRVFGRWTMFVITSFSGEPSRSFGRSLSTLRSGDRVTFGGGNLAGVWMEAVIRVRDGTWYGFYHQEQPVPACNVPRKVVPRIGAARSTDFGRTWEDLGPILEAPPGTITCDTRNYYFMGGIGDFTVLLDHDGNYAYIFYTQYIERTGGVGVSLARMAWADRDEPMGKVTVWNDGAWLPAQDVAIETADGDHYAIVYPAATPFFVAKDRWDNASTAVDVFWGPAVHWNTYLNEYVMLLNRASSNEWKQEGIYLSSNATLDDPRAWTTPTKLYDGGKWYPQVVGLETITGTDKQAGETARFYMSGTSEHLIRFTR